MAVYKRKYDSGTVLWFYKFSPPGGKRGTLPIRQFGFATKQQAVDAEAQRRIEELRKHELAKAGSGMAAAVPKTLSMLFQEFLRQHAEEKLAPKTVERYREQLAYLDPDLLSMPLADHAAASQQGMEPFAQGRWSLTQEENTPPSVGEDGPKHRRRCLLGVWARSKMGPPLRRIRLPIASRPA